MKRLGRIFCIGISMIMIGAISTRDTQAASLKLVALNVARTSVYTGTSIKLKASAKGGSGKKKYKYTYLLAGQTYTIKGYSSSTSVSYKPSASGSYSFKVTAKDAKGRTKTKSRSVTVYAKPSAGISAVSSMIVNHSTTITASASGGYGTKKYMIQSYYGSSVSTLKGYGTGKTATFKPTKTGTYTIKVTVKDAKNKTSTKTKSISVEAQANYSNTEATASSTTGTVGTVKSIASSINGGYTFSSASYATSNQSVCLVTDDGYIMPIGAGTATLSLTGTVNGQSAKRYLKISVTDKSTVKVGCDISSWQGSSVNFAALKSVGIDYTILRAGHGLKSTEKPSYGKDTCFIGNVAKCKAAGMAYGVYWYVDSNTVANAKAEVDDLYEQLSATGISFDYPIYVDLESENIYSGQTTTDGIKAQTKQITQAFISELVAKGISAERIGVYANKSYFENYLSDSYYGNYALWFARYSYSATRPTFTMNGTIYKAQMWQVNDNFSGVAGISGDLDMDYYYTD